MTSHFVNRCAKCGPVAMKSSDYLCRRCISTLISVALELPEKTQKTIAASPMGFISGFVYHSNRPL